MKTTRKTIAELIRDSKRQIEITKELLAIDGLDPETTADASFAYEEAALWLMRWECGADVDLRAMSDDARRIFCRRLASL